MGKAVKKLSARAVATIAKPGRHSDGDGLYLNVTRSGARSWLFMWKKDGKPVPYAKETEDFTMDPL